MTLLLIGFLGGLITGISPCILPVLPVVFLTGGAQSARYDGVVPASRARPFLVVAGLMLSFTLVTLFGSLLLSLLNLPQDVLRWAGIALLVIMGIALIVPRLEQLLERPFQFLPKKEVGNRGSGFGVGLALGTVFVPCAGPILAAIIVAGATGQIGWDTVLLTVSFAIGVAIPLLAFALAGRGVIERIRAFRRRERLMRIIAGCTMVLLAIGLVFNVPAALQRLIPDYTAGLQKPLADSDAVAGLGGLVTDENRLLDNCPNGADELNECGTAPAIRGIDTWLNTAGGAPVNLSDLRGQVVLIDFWAYSCINCQRSIPHVVAWDKAYRDAGLQVIGVHSPEYAFEKDAANVAAGAKDFGITYPVALDNSLSTWTAYRNRYWPAHYLIDAEGTVRQISLGEGHYETTERLIRELLSDADPTLTLPGETEVADQTPELGTTTRETFLGSTKEVNYSGAERYRAGERESTIPDDQPEDTFALGGRWKIGTQNAEPVGSDGLLRLRYRAAEVRVVLSGEGTVRVTGGDVDTIEVAGTPRSHLVLNRDQLAAGTVELSVPPGVQVYSMTFG